MYSLVCDIYFHLFYRENASAAVSPTKVVLAFCFASCVKCTCVGILLSDVVSLVQPICIVAISFCVEVGNMVCDKHLFVCCGCCCILTIPANVIAHEA